MKKFFSRIFRLIGKNKKEKEKRVYVFCDTMVFLHYRLFPQIDFPSLLNMKPITLVIPEQVSHEIDYHKNSNQNKRLRERAGRASKKIAEFIDKMDINSKSMTTKITDDYFLEYLMCKKINFKSYGLDSENNDHKIIASILEFRACHPTDEIFFFTHDNAATITARSHNISTRRLPDSLKLADDLSEDEQRIKQLEAECAKYKKAFPELSLVHKKTKDFKIVYTLDDALSFKLPERVESFETIFKETPPYEEKILENDNNISDIFAAVLYDGKRTEKENKDIKRYMQERDVYFSNYKSYLESLNKYKEKLLFPVEMVILNTGIVPAKDVDLFVHFPDGFLMFPECDPPKLPSPPTKPHPPKTYFELTTSLGSDFYHRLSFDLPQLEETAFKMPRSFSLNKTNSYEFKKSLSVVKHGDHIITEIDKLFIVFDSFSSIKSFSADFIISGSNIPHAIYGNLYFIFDALLKEAAQPETKKTQTSC